ncbi:hypothetical protein TthSNM11_10880 [Thermus thermophilus]|nr:hypothetical protein TthSNM11_10880 [Thermus thermophilus]
MVLLLFLLALLPRSLLLHLEPPFWFDEDWTEETGLMPLPAMVLRLWSEDFHPLLGYLLLGLWARLMHAFSLEAEVFYRLLPALLGAYSTVVLFRALRTFLPPWRAFLVALVYALVPQGVLQDVEFRQYALAKLAVALALEASLTGRPWAWAGYGALAFHLHYLAGLVALAFLPGLKKPWGRHLLLYALPLLLWAPVLFHQASKLHSIARWVGTPDERLPETLAFLLFSEDPALRVLGVLFWGLALGGLMQSPLRPSLTVLAFGSRGSLYLGLLAAYPTLRLPPTSPSGLRPRLGFSDAGLRSAPFDVALGVALVLAVGGGKRLGHFLALFSPMRTGEGRLRLQLPR